MKKPIEPPKATEERPLTWEERQAEPRVQKSRKRTPKGNMSPAQRKSLLSPKHLEHLRRNREKMAAEGRRPHIQVGSVQGWGGSRRKVLERLRAEAAIKAEKIMKTLEETGVIEPDMSEVVGADGTVNDTAAANAALKFCIGVVLAKETYGVQDAMRAASTVLQYTKAKPETKTTVKVDAAHDWLMSVIEAEKEPQE